jgi:hypothetical protein
VFEKRFLVKFFAVLMITTIFLIAAACAGTPVKANETPPESNSQPVSEQKEPTKIAVNTIPAEPQEITFKAIDGQELKGRYYPAAIESAPLVVLMHWINSDQNDWIEIAYWLQNRGLGGKTANPQKMPWLNSTWFPIIKAGKSYAVFTFSYRDCSAEKYGCTKKQWLLDSQAAMLKARELPGIHPKKILAVGASIGADGAADGCQWVNARYPNTCLGAAALSPVNYLILSFETVVQQLGAENPATPVWCFYSSKDRESAVVCDPIDPKKQTNFMPYKYTDEKIYHGMNLIQPSIKPNPLDLLLEVIQQTIDK